MNEWPALQLTKKRGIGVNKGLFGQDSKQKEYKSAMYTSNLKRNHTSIPRPDPDKRSMSFSGTFASNDKCNGNDGVIWSIQTILPHKNLKPKFGRVNWP